LVATWSEFWSLIRKPAAATAIYLAILYIRFFKPSVSSKVKDEVMALLVEHNLVADELVEVQRALDIFIELFDRDLRKEKDIESALDSLERDNYEFFKNALYSYLKKDVPLDEIKKGIQTLIMRRVKASSIFIASLFLLMIEIL